VRFNVIVSSDDTFGCRFPSFFVMPWRSEHSPVDVPENLTVRFDFFFIPTTLQINAELYTPLATHHHHMNNTIRTVLTGCRQTDNGIGTTCRGLAYESSADVAETRLNVVRAFVVVETRRARAHAILSAGRTFHR